MSDSRRSSHNSAVMVVVIVAGLACGGVVAWQLTGAGSPAPEPDPPVLESQRLPWDDLHPEEAAAADTVATSPADDPPATDQPEEYEVDAERVIVQAERLTEDAGVTDFVEVDDELFIHVSVKLVLMATALADEPDGRDMLVDYEARLLAEEKIDADDWYEYAKLIGRDADRTAQMGEAILREAERRTDMSINVRGVTDLSPSQVAVPTDE